MDLDLEFIIYFNLLNYKLKLNVNENEFYVLKKNGDWKLKNFSKNSSGYLITSFSFEKNKETLILKHRLVYFAYNQDFDIFKRSTTENMIDHVDRDKSNNFIENLRIVTNQQNLFNQKARGYCFNKQRKKWQARIQINKKQKFLGLFDTEEEASEAYLKAKKIYHIIN